MDKFLHVTGCDCEAAHAEQSQHSAEEVVSSILESDSDKPNQFDSTIRMMANENAVETLKGLGYELRGFRWCRPVTDEEWEPDQRTVQLISEKLSSVRGDLMGGYHDEDEYQIFCHGMQTQVNVVNKMLHPTPEQLAEEERKKFCYDAEDIFSNVDSISMRQSNQHEIAGAFYDAGYRIAQGEGK